MFDHAQTEVERPASISIDYDIDSESIIRALTQPSDQMSSYSQILIFDLMSRTCLKSTFQEALDIKANSNEKLLVILYQNVNDDDIRKIRQSYNLHPVLDIECSNSLYNNKDTLQIFDGYFLLSLNDASASDNIESTTSMKIVILPDKMLIFSSDYISSLEKVFFHELKFKFKHQNAAKTSKKLHQYSTRVFLENGLNEILDYSQIDLVLLMILDIIFARLEVFALEIYEEAKVCFNFSTKLSIHERVEFILRISLAEKNLIYLDGLIRPKVHLFVELIKSDLVSHNVKQYLISMQFRSSSLLKKLNSALSILENSERINDAIVDDEISKSTKRITRIMKHFSCLTAIFIPISFSTGLFGMNIKVPFGSVNNMGPFSGILGFSLLYFLVITIILGFLGYF